MMDVKALFTIFASFAVIVPVAAILLSLYGMAIHSLFIFFGFPDSLAELFAIITVLFNILASAMIYLHRF